jgi:cobalamin biosynthesis protein CobD/CbiB
MTTTAGLSTREEAAGPASSPSEQLATCWREVPALGVRLGGRNHYGDRVEERPALGGGPLPTPDDVERAVLLSLLVGAATAAVVAITDPSRARARSGRRARRRRGPG